MISFLSFQVFFSAHFIRFLINHFPSPGMSAYCIGRKLLFVVYAAGPRDSHLLYIKIVNRQNGRVWPVVKI